MRQCLLTVGAVMISILAVRDAERNETASQQRASAYNKQTHILKHPTKHSLYACYTLVFHHFVCICLSLFIIIIYYTSRTSRTDRRMDG